MPLYKIEKIKADHYIAIWHIEESFDDLLASLSPSEADQVLVTSYKSQKKKSEWLSGRLCLKHLCGHMGIPYSGIIKNDNGKPFLINSKAEISLTHSYPYVAAVIDKNNDVGIDLEQPKEKLQKVAHKFLGEKEIENSGNDLQSLCIHWCAKETLYKICAIEKLNFIDNMYIEPFELVADGTLIGNVIIENVIQSYTLAYRIEKDYIMTYNC